MVVQGEDTPGSGKIIDVGRSASTHRKNRIRHSTCVRLAWLRAASMNDWSLGGEIYSSMSSVLLLQ